MPITLEIIDNDLEDDPYMDIWDDTEHRQCEDPVDCWMEIMGE